MIREIRELRPGLYEDLISLWMAAGLPCRPQGRDSREAMADQIARNPDLFLGCFVSERLVGSAIASDDGRKGWINRVAVHPDCRRQGIARELIFESERRLRARGRTIIGLLVHDHNEASLRLCQTCGYEADRSVVYLRKREDAGA